MTVFKKVVTNAVFSLQILVILFLVFQDRLAIPPWVQAVGRMHPLLLHLPIGFLILLALLPFLQNEFKRKAFQRAEQFVLLLSAVTTSLTALMGIILADEGGYEADALKTHQVGGAFLSFLVALLLIVKINWPKATTPYRALLTVAVLSVILTGHFGATLTHGENFITEPLREEEDLIVTDSTSLYAMAVEPILKKKCMSCHSENKSKGGLVMTTTARILEGGEHGAIWVAGKPDSSEMVIRALLPEEDEDHMPPVGKVQLTETELELLSRWIASGADVKKPWTTYRSTDTLLLLVKAAQPKAQVATPRYTFSFASAKTLALLNSPYCTVAPIAASEPALKADFYVARNFDIEALQNLQEVKQQLIHLNLSGMPINDQQASVVLQFSNLEKLNLNNTGITGAFVAQLATLTKLTSLSLDGTAVGADALQALAALPALKDVFIWNTDVTPAEINALRSRSKINWVDGFAPSDKLTLTPPILVNESFLLDEEGGVMLKHNLPGTTLQYTTDGTDPDSSRAQTYSTPVPIERYTVVKARAVKTGWYSSAVVTFHFFRRGLAGIQAELLTKADKDYRGEGALTLTDGKKGDNDNYRDIGWLGFRDNAAIALFTLEKPRYIKQVTVSFHQNIGSYLMPPASVELWGGPSSTQLKLIQKAVPAQPSRYEPNAVPGIILKVNSSSYSTFKLIVNPVSKLPTWHGGKGKKGWVFLDEVIFE